MQSSDLQPGEICSGCNLQTLADSKWTNQEPGETRVGRAEEGERTGEVELPERVASAAVEEAVEIAAIGLAETLFQLGTPKNSGL